MECDDHMCHSICPNCGEEVVTTPTTKTGILHCCKNNQKAGTVYCIKLKDDKNV